MERAQYSDSDEEDEHKEEPKKRPAKKARTKAPTSSSANASAGPSLPAQHRKTYEWLQPSTASASHSGPPVRKREEKKEEQIDDELEELLPKDEAKDDKPRKSHKKRPADAPGPGKHWRKGLKK